MFFVIVFFWFLGKRRKKKLSPQTWALKILVVWFLVFGDTLNFCHTTPDYKHMACLQAVSLPVYKQSPCLAYHLHSASNQCLQPQ